jgi:hypothetical protein
VFRINEIIPTLLDYWTALRHEPLELVAEGAVLHAEYRLGGFLEGETGHLKQLPKQRFIERPFGAYGRFSLHLTLTPRVEIFPLCLRELRVDLD